MSSRFAGIVGQYLDDPKDDEERADMVEYVERALARRLRHSGKACSKCEESKPLSAFGVDASARDGLRRDCKACRP